MAIIKLTTLFQYASNVGLPNAPIHRTGGFSESWYYTGASANDAVTFAQNGANGIPGLWPARAALLPTGSSIVGYRSQVLSPAVGPTQSGAINFPGPSTYVADQPQAALLLKVPGVGVSNIRRIKLKAIPDAQITQGEFSPTADYLATLNAFIASLVTWQFQGRDLAQPATRIVSITGPEPYSVLFEANVAFAVNDFVRINRALDSSKNLRGGRFMVTAVAGGNSISIRGWPYGNCTLGKGRKDLTIYPTVNVGQTNYQRIVTAKVGRPFLAYHGRRSKRR
jgi:hypothetical protein